MPFPLRNKCFVEQFVHVTSTRSDLLPWKSHYQRVGFELNGLQSVVLCSLPSASNNRQSTNSRDHFWSKDKAKFHLFPNQQQHKEFKSIQWTCNRSFENYARPSSQLYTTAPGINGSYDSDSVLLRKDGERSSCGSALIGQQTFQFSHEVVDLQSTVQCSLQSSLKSSLQCSVQCRMLISKFVSHHHFGCQSCARACCLATSPPKEKTTDTEKHMLPDDEIGPARYRTPERLFRPDLIGEGCEGIHKVLTFSIQKSHLGLQRTLYGNSMLSSGSTLFKGMMSVSRIAASLPSSRTFHSTRLCEKSFIRSSTIEQLDTTAILSDYSLVLPKLKELWSKRKESKMVNGRYVIWVKDLRVLTMFKVKLKARKQYENNEFKKVVEFKNACFHSAYEDEDLDNLIKYCKEDEEYLKPFGKKLSEVEQLVEEIRQYKWIIPVYCLLKDGRN